MEPFFIVIAFAFAALTGIVVKKKFVVESVSLIASFVALVASINIALKVSVVGIYAPTQWISIDALSAIVMLVVGFMGFPTTLYAIAYFRKETQKGIIGLTRVRQYFVLVNFFLVAMFAAIMSSSPIVAWICIEATTLSTAFLISFYNKPSAVEAAWKYLIINSIGLLLGFFGTLLYFTSLHGLQGSEFVSWQLLKEHSGSFDPMLAKIAFIFVLIGYGTKIGFVPMHTWKPDAYSKAPSPLGALLSGALVPISFATLLKFKVLTDSAIGVTFSQHLLVVFGVISIAIAALIMFNSKNYKRLLAYSSIEHAGIMALGFGFGGAGVFAATLHLIYHSCVKGIMFFSSGNLLLKYNSAKIHNVRGALSVVPVTSVLFIAGFLIVTGTPPFGIFMTKMTILSVGIQLYPITSIVALFFMVIVFIGFLRHVTTMFFGDNTVEAEYGEGSVWLIISPMIFLSIVVILSFYIPSFLLHLINTVVVQY